MDTKIKVWDGFIRGYHWLQLALMAGLWFTAEQGLMDYHLLLAYVLLPLLVTRLLWGIFGSQTARFVDFVRSPRQGLLFWRTLRAGQVPRYAGHNPLGGWMVVALLVLIAFQLASGLFADDSILTSGPLAHLVSESTSERLTSLHHLNFKLILLLATVHVAAVGIHRLKGEHLIKAMFSGYKVGLENAAIKLRNPWLAWGIFLVLLGLVCYGWAWPLLSMLGLL